LITPINAEMLKSQNPEIYKSEIHILALASFRMISGFSDSEI
jgi:hypothetical protein